MSGERGGGLSRAAAAGLAGWIGLAGPAAAHPHMFFDAEATLAMDASGRLSAVEVLYKVDELNSLTIATDLGVDPIGPFSAEDEATVLDAFAVNLGDYGWYVSLRRGGEPLAFTGAIGRSAVQEGDFLTVRMELPLAAPFVPGAEPVLLQLYDPTYFTDVALRAAPAVGGEGASGCAVEWERFEPDAAALEAQRLLALIPADETPSEENVGRRFADRIHLRCATGQG